MVVPGENRSAGPGWPWRLGLRLAGAGLLAAAGAETAKVYGDCDRWFRHVEEVTAVMMQDISRVCMVAGLTCHVDMTKPQRGEGERPPTPGASSSWLDARRIPLVVLSAKGEGAWATPLPDDWGPVRRLQWMLRKRFGHELKVDGDFGPRTLAVVKSFQQKAGLKPDGLAGPLTWARVMGR